MSKCEVCGEQYKRQGLAVHKQRAHNPNNNYTSRRGARFLYDDENRLHLMSTTEIPKIHPLQILIDNPTITQWELCALRSRERIMANHNQANIVEENKL